MNVLATALNSISIAIPFNTSHKQPPLGVGNNNKSSHCRGVYMLNTYERLSKRHPGNLGCYTSPFFNFVNPIDYIFREPFLSYCCPPEFSAIQRQPVTSGKEGASAHHAEQNARLLHEQQFNL